MNAACFKISIKDKLGLLFLSTASSCPALAHHPMGGETPTTLWQGLLSGLAHPVIELDHLLLLIGIATATAIARIAPKQAMTYLLALVAAGVVGTSMRVASLTIPFAEAAAAISLLLVGLWLWITKLSGFAAVGLWVVGGFFHGFAYGGAIIGSEATPLVAYVWGLALVQALLMIGTYLIVRNYGMVTEKNLTPVARATSSVISSIALWMLWTAI